MTHDSSIGEGVGFEIRPREAVILASSFAALVAWYRDVLGFTVRQLFEDAYHYGQLETASGLRIAIADAGEMGVEPADRARNTVVLQIEVDDVRTFFAHVEANGGAITAGPNHDPTADFWFGGVADPEGNPMWVVDRTCP
jgi:predicted enzyme related to lactoylglutathione lyase